MRVSDDAVEVLEIIRTKIDIGFNAEISTVQRLDPVISLLPTRKDIVLDVLVERPYDGEVGWLV